MKHGLLYIIAALMLILGTSCVKEMSGVQPYEGDDEVTLSLNVFTGGMKDVIVKSKWENNDEFERAVYNLRIYIFSESGRLAGYGLFGEFSTSEVEDGYNAKIEHVHTQTGEKLFIYAIANAVNSQYWVSDDNILNIDDASTSTLTREQFLRATYTRQKGAYDPRDNQFLMTGYVNDGNPVTIDRIKDSKFAEITGVANEDAKRLKLYKVMSKNSIEIKTDTGISFNPDYMEIYNMPSVVALMRELPVAADDVLRPAAGDFETFERIVLDESEFIFYLPENLQKTDYAVKTFNDREQNSYTAGVKGFDNAPENATYIVVHGRYESSDYKGNVAYTIHLGDFSKEMSDFNVVRNYFYKYTLTINGVNNFIAESKCEADRFDHGSEGIIINTTAGELLDVDCHYESRVLKFNKSELADLIADNFGYIIKLKTAFCETRSLLVVSDYTKGTVTVPAGIYDAADYKEALDKMQKPELLSTIATDGTISDEATLLLKGSELDFDWLHFVVNTNARVTYPGTDNRGAQTHKIDEVGVYPGKAKTMNVFQFFQKLHEAAINGDKNFFNQNGETVYVTCFIDENYYEKKNWQEFVNVNEDRVLYCANTFQTSLDGKSSYAEAKYVISQKPIWTFYSANVKHPFGMEMVSEEDEIRKKDESFFLTGSSDNKQHEWNGYDVAVKNNANATRNNRNKYAYSVYQNVGTQDLYRDPYKACMSRNRDENGDGTIDASEVKWYLAAVDQYKGMWIADDYLPTNVKLFQPTVENWTKLNNTWKGKDENLYPWHYFTASSQNTFWAEEGCATGDQNKAAKIRCIRTLESKGSGQREADTYYSKSSVGSGTATETLISLNLADGATRSFQESAQQPSYERGEGHTNKLYKQFKVASSNIGPYDRTEILNMANGEPFIAANADVCQASKGKGWRVPTQKELSLISAVLTKEQLGLKRHWIWSKLDYDYDFLWSNTSYTGLKKDYYKHNQSGTSGFGFGYDEAMTIAPEHRGYVRCVMDVKE